MGESSSSSNRILAELPTTGMYTAPTHTTRARIADFTRFLNNYLALSGFVVIARRIIVSIPSIVNPPPVCRSVASARETPPITCKTPNQIVLDFKDFKILFIYFVLKL